MRLCNFVGPSGSLEEGQEKEEETFEKNGEQEDEGRSLSRTEQQVDAIDVNININRESSAKFVFHAAGKCKKPSLFRKVLTMYGLGGLLSQRRLDTDKEDLWVGGGGGWKD